MIGAERGRRGGLIDASGQVGLWEGCWEIKRLSKGLASGCWEIGTKWSSRYNFSCFFIKGIFIDLFPLHRAINFFIF